MRDKSCVFWKDQLDLSLEKQKQNSSCKSLRNVGLLFCFIFLYHAFCMTCNFSFSWYSCYVVIDLSNATVIREKGFNHQHGSLIIYKGGFVLAVHVCRET